MLLASVAALAVLCGPAGAQPGTITTRAGSGSYGFSGEGGAAGAAQLDTVYALAADAEGNLFVADSWNHRVRKVAPDGRITTVAGTGEEGFAGDGGQATAARLSCPRGLAVDGQGNLFIADSGNARVRKVGRDGVITTVAGSGTEGFSGDNGRATAAQLKVPRGLAVDSRGNLYIADSWNCRVRRVAPDGTITTVAGKGTYGYKGDGGRAVDAELGAVQGLALDAQGNLYISDPYNHCVRKMLPDGRIRTAAGGGGYGTGGDGVLGESCQLRYPRGVAVDAQGNLYIADSANHRVRKVTPGNAIGTVAGSGAWGYEGDGAAAGCAQFNYPYALATDARGVLYIADARNYRVRASLLETAIPRPTVSAGGVVNAASSRAPVAPGSLISIYGQGLTSGRCGATALPLSTSLGSASVTAGGRALPLTYVSGGQINAQLPSDLAPGRASLKVSYSAVESAAVEFEVAARAPGVFMWGDGRGAILNQDYSLNMPEAPAARGSVATLYATGQGRVDPGVPDGAAASADPLSRTSSNPEVSVGGAPAQVLFSGLAPGFVGLWQINIVVPQSAPVGSDVPVRVAFGSASNEVKMAVR
ncbi:MAG: IPT/TIG domain-containing protein [Acidobacteriota bacterium]